MNKLYLLSLVLVLASCGATVSNKEPLSPQQTYCESLSRNIAQMAAIKWAERESKSEATLEKIEGWRLISFVYAEPLGKMGLSSLEIQTVAKEVYNTDIMNDRNRDPLSHGYYTKAKCELEKNGSVVASLSDSVPAFRQCWQGENTANSPLMVGCFKKVLEGN